MNSWLNTLKAAKNRVSLAPQRQQAIRKNIAQFMDKNPPLKLKAADTADFFSWLGHLSQRFKAPQFALSFLVLAVLLVGSVAGAAEHALPGDLLYYVKVGINEKVYEVVAEPGKEEWAERLAERRRNETLRLSAQKKAATAIEQVAVNEKDYSSALNRYGGGARFQFVNCAGTPGSLSVKSGNAFMLDNRDNETHSIKVGTVAYSIKPYGFMVIKIQKAGQYPITCDGGGSAMVKVHE